jgi:hypothetical protein
MEAGKYDLLRQVPCTIAPLYAVLHGTSMYEENMLPYKMHQYTHENAHANR